VKPRERIPVSAPQTGLQSPFAALDLGPLPPGPEVRPAPEQAPAKHKGRIVLRREKAQRGGKTVVVASDLPTHLSPPEIEILARQARQACGCGGTVRGREIELQGDQPDRVRAFFEKLGFRVVGP